MIIKNFIGEKIHGFLDFNISFDSKINFLTGINGSGKTTVVSAIAYLLSPSLVSLFQTEFKSLRIELVDRGQEISIWSKKRRGKLELGISSTDQVLIIETYPGEYVHPVSPRKFRESERDYFRDVEIENFNHSVIQKIHDLPTPLYLGIERKISSSIEVEDRIEKQKYLRRPIDFSTPIYEVGISQAIKLVETAYQKILSEERKLTEQLREKLILNAIRYQPFTKMPEKVLKFSPQEIENKIKVTYNVLGNIGLDKNILDKEIKPFFSRIEKISNILGNKEDTDDIFKKGDATEIRTYVEWITNYPQIERINFVTTLAEEYLQQIQLIRDPINRFKAVLEGFLSDCKKNIHFDDTGNLRVKISNSIYISPTTLSSGESQILVMISHLCFNPYASTETAFIIDEPELSLHLKWQEMFVDSLQKANPNMQLILATHSPSIILDRTENCINLGN